MHPAIGSYSNPRYADTIDHGKATLDVLADDARPTLAEASGLDRVPSTGTTSITTTNCIGGPNLFEPIRGCRPVHWCLRKRAKESASTANSPSRNRGIVVPMSGGRSEGTRFVDARRKPELTRSTAARRCPPSCSNAPGRTGHLHADAYHRIAEKPRRHPRPHR